jgi:hypothetical protein
MASTISAGTTSGTAIAIAGDTSGALVLQTNGTTTAVTISTAQDATFAGKVTSAGALTLASNGTTTAVTIDTSQNVGIGTATPTFFSGGGLQISKATQANLRLSDTANANYNFDISNNSGDGYLINRFATGNIFMFTNSTERMRIDSGGNVQIGRTSVIQNGRLSVQNVIGSNTIETIQGGSGGYNYYSSAATNGGSYYHATFTENNTQRGSIVSNGTNTLYNTSSDQRLKENIKDAESSLSLVGDLQVRQFDWKSCNSHQNYGFVAQELAIIAPEALHQPSDPEEMMAVDYSKLVPMLVKAIQEQQALITQLQADVAALKGVKA